jgi:hypothetical protein
MINNEEKSYVSMEACITIVHTQQSSTHEQQMLASIKISSGREANLSQLMVVRSRADRFEPNIKDRCR